MKNCNEQNRKPQNEHTEPLTIGFDSGAWKIFGLILVSQDMTLTVTNGSGFVHLETADGGGGALLGLGVIAPVSVVGVLWFTGEVNVSLFLLRHCRDTKNGRKVELGFVSTVISVSPILL